MTEVSAELGLTLPIPGVDFGMVKPVIRVDGIDTDGDVDAQLKAGVEVGVKALAVLDDQMDVALLNLLAPEMGKPGYRERLEKTESLLEGVRKTLNEAVTRLNSISAEKGSDDG